MRIADCGLRIDRGSRMRTAIRNPQSANQSAIRNPRSAIRRVDRHRGAERSRAPCRADRQPAEPRLPRRRAGRSSSSPTDRPTTRSTCWRGIGASSTSSRCRPAARRWRSTPAWPGRGSTSWSSPTRARCSRRTRCASSSRRSPIGGRRASPASCCSTPSRPAGAPAAIAARSSGAIGARARPRSDRREDERRRTLRSTIADGVGLYWKYEKQLRRLESAVGSTLGATGAIYAIRRALYRPLPADTILDDVLTPMRVVLAGLPRGLQRAGARVRSRRRPMRTPRRAARSGRSPATTRSSRSSRGCCCRGATRSGSSTCRTSSGGSRCRMRCSRFSSRASSLTGVSGTIVSFYGAALSGQVLLLPARRRRRGARACAPAATTSRPSASDSPVRVRTRARQRGRSRDARWSRGSRASRSRS